MSDKHFHAWTQINGIESENCFEILIDSGSFSEIPFKMNLVNENTINETLVNEKNGLKH